MVSADIEICEVVSPSLHCYASKVSCRAFQFAMM